MLGVLTNLINGTTGVQYFDTTHSTWATIDATDLEAVVSLLPQYADTADACWIVSRKFWANVMLRLVFAQGGATGREMVEGFRKNSIFMGYPVVISQVMPTAIASITEQIPCVLGDFKQGAKFGDRQQYVIATSDSANSAFFNLQLALLMYERFDIQSKFAVGDATHSGAYVGLEMA
jgi:HK97 family phage major capsid protein